MRWMSVVLAGGLMAALAGCGQPKSDMAMGDMTPPPRPAELDRLNTMVGNWDATFEMKMAGMDKTMKGHGTSHCDWQCDKTILVEHVEGEMEGSPHKFHGMGLYTWDPSAKVYRAFWFDNEGRMDHSQMTYNEATKTWHTKGNSVNTMTGEKGNGKGTIKVVDANTMEWSGVQYGGFLGMSKQMEMTGTSKRRM